MNVATIVKCDHFFCNLNGKKLPSVAIVERTCANGAVISTPVCADHFTVITEALDGINQKYTVIKL